MIYQKYTGEVKIKNKGGINLTINKDNLIKKQQEEIERLNTTIQSNINSYNKLAKYSSDLEDRIDKAIKHIKENYSNPDGEIWHKDIEKILVILEGDDKE